MRQILITPPAIEPITLTEAKNHCRVDSCDDDDLIRALITSARQYAEKFTKRAFINQTWMLSYDLREFPQPWEDRYNYYSLFRSWSWMTNCRVVELPLGVIQSVTSFNYYDADNNASTFNASNYRLSTPRIVLNNNAEWPQAEREFDAIEITFVAGYGTDRSGVPQDIKQAILLTVAHWYENREASGDFAAYLSPEKPQGLLPIGVTVALRPYQILTIG